MSESKRMKMSLSTEIQTERGATVIEYALLLSLLAVVSIISVGSLGEAAAQAFSQRRVPGQSGQPAAMGGGFNPGGGGGLGLGGGLPQGNGSIPVN